MIHRRQAKLQTWELHNIHCRHWKSLRASELIGKFAKRAATALASTTGRCLGPKMKNEAAKITASFRATTTAISRPSEGFNMTPDLHNGGNANLM
jgi:hypothetical protein